MFNTRFRSLALFLLMGLSLLTARAAEPLSSPTLRKIRDTGVIVLGYRVASAPFSYLDADLKPVGYSIELCERVVQAVRSRLQLPELEAKMVSVSSATRMPMVANGSVDLECGITTHTAERQRIQAFSLTTFVAETRLLSKRQRPIRSLDELRGLPVASTIATTSIQFLHQINQTRELDMKILVGQDDKDAFRLLQTGRAVAYAMDDVLLRTWLAGSGRPQDYLISEASFSIEPYALGLAQGDPGFKQLVDEALRALFRSGEIRTIYQRWFESPLPGSGLNLRLPMSPAFLRLTEQPSDSPDPAQYR
ncbi:amino acid ABC transporter substrate-binding protein [Paucibacter sp. DJ1R-11]|uniref:amino acid ABC transporter substrate-binding protein n=1 Tax=Paucibacter sp. DJ1R-11 TaxID=2893556 RepID=UPI0021E37F34|nr:amino acid ABC transporter substrate-binding protein [Paucibacter sp. DJ1R-11]MCV2366006.1 amino acid ABC transporter substrate-binding protein [Paucibacter sp. DJ1R-11]